MAGMRMKEANHHEFGSVHQVVETSSDRSFGFIFASVLVIITVYQGWHGSAWWPVLLAAASVFLILAFARPELLAPLNGVWTRVGLLLGAIVAPIVMVVIYFAFITPMALVARLFGKDFLRLTSDTSASTYWLLRQDHEQTPDRLRDQF